MTGLDILRAIQTIQNPVLDRFFLFVTDLHGELVYLLVLPLLLWLYDKRFARYMATLFVLGNWFNDLLKDLFNTQRPLATDVRVVRPEHSGAFPSGHSQNPLIFWGAMALHVRRRWFTVAMVVLIVLIGFSRLYLGVHWPLDVIGGWTLGAFVLWGLTTTSTFWTGEAQPYTIRLFWAVSLPVALVIITALLGELPAMSTPKESAGDLIRILGAYFGFNIGSVLEDRYVGFDPRRGNPVVKVILGMVLLLAVKEGFKLFLPATALGDLIRYGLVAAMATLGAPWAFHRFVSAPPAGHKAA